jgi:hypothetical protein
MELLDLSNEILGLILENVGAENFTANVNRLLVCRRWYLLAQPVMLQVVWLTIYNLRPFTRVPDRMQELIGKGTQTISIDFFGFEEESMLELLEEDRVELQKTVSNGGLSQLSNTTTAAPFSLSSHGT